MKRNQTFHECLKSMVDLCVEEDDDSLSKSVDSLAQELYTRCEDSDPLKAEFYRQWCLVRGLVD